eukprot:30871-Pelagococcus_subviridis.AAC.3
MPFTVVMTVVTNVNTNTRPKNTAANVDPKLVEYSGNGNAFTARPDGDVFRGAGRRRVDERHAHEGLIERPLEVRERVVLLPLRALADDPAFKLFARPPRALVPGGDVRRVHAHAVRDIARDRGQIVREDHDAQDARVGVARRRGGRDANRFRLVDGADQKSLNHRAVTARRVHAPDRAQRRAQKRGRKQQRRVQRHTVLPGLQEPGRGVHARGRVALARRERGVERRPGRFAAAAAD